jgi:hypothetical protein
MATTKTYPVPTWVRTIVCLAPFVMTIAAMVMFLSAGRGFALLSGALAVCAQVIKHVLTKQ